MLALSCLRFRVFVFMLDMTVRSESSYVCAHIDVGPGHRRPVKGNLPCPLRPTPPSESVPSLTDAVVA